MIKIFAKNIDLLKVSKILLPYKGFYQITSDGISIYSDTISENLLENLISYLDLIKISNYAEKEISELLPEKEISEPLPEKENSEPLPEKENSEPLPEKEISELSSEKENTELLAENENSESLLDNKSVNNVCESLKQEEKIKFSKIKRGELYYANCSNTQLGLRPVLIVQNDEGNKYSPYTIVVPITSKNKKPFLPTHLSISTKSLVEGKLDGNSTLLAENIESMHKSCLTKYIGRVAPSFMKGVDEILSCSIDIKPKEIPQIIEHSFIDINLEQIGIITKFDNVPILVEISSKKISNEEKVKEMLNIFGFDFTKNGANYLAYAICYAPKNSEYFNLSDTIENIPKNLKSVSDKEVQRLITARIKETLNLKNLSAISFIRFINLFLTKREDNYE